MSNNSDRTTLLELSVIFSFKNEAENLCELTSRVNRVIQSIPEVGSSYELIFVDDASEDNSNAILRDLAKTFPIKIIKMSRTFGTAPCVMAGLSASKGGAVVYMDSDLQDPPELIVEMFKLYLSGFDVVHATRISREGEPKSKLILTWLAYKIINFFSQIKLRSQTGDFKLLSRQAVNSIISLKESDPYMRGLSVWVGFKQSAVFYDREARHAGETKFPLLSSNPRKEFVRGLTSFSDGPLLLSIYIGGLTCLSAIGAIIYALIAKFFDIAVLGSSGIIIFIAFFSGMILLSNGVMGLYISKIFFEVKNRPAYIVESIFESDQSHNTFDKKPSEKEETLRN